jgi:hypothetical protein
MKHILLGLTVVLLSVSVAAADFSDNFDSYATGPLTVVSGGVWNLWGGASTDAEVVDGGLSPPNAMKHTGNATPDVVTYFTSGLGYGMTATFSFDYLAHEAGDTDMKTTMFVGSGDPVFYNINYDSSLGSFVFDEGNSPGTTQVQFAGMTAGAGLPVDTWHHVEVVFLQTVEHITSNGPSEPDGVFDVYLNSELVIAQAPFTLNDPVGFNALEMWSELTGGGGDDYHLFDNFSVVFAPAPPPKVTAWTSDPVYDVWPNGYVTDQGQPFSEYSTQVPVGPPYLVNSNGWSAVMADVPANYTGYMKMDIQPGAVATGDPIDLTGSNLHFTLRWDGPPTSPSDQMAVWVRAWSGAWDGAAWSDTGQMAWFAWVPIDRQWHEFVENTSLPEYTNGTPDPESVYRFRVDFVFWESAYTPARMGVQHLEVRYPSAIDLPKDATGSAVGVEPRDNADTLLKLAFDKPMATPVANAVEIVGVTNTTPVYPTLALDDSSESIILATVPGGLPNNDRYTATIVGNLLDIFGHDIQDGENYDLDVEFYVLEGDALGGVNVDLSDFAKFAECFDGLLNHDCFRADIDMDADVDVDDYVRFGSAMTGPLGP